VLLDVRLSLLSVLLFVIMTYGLLVQVGTALGAAAAAAAAAAAGVCCSLRGCVAAVGMRSSYPPLLLNVGLSLLSVLLYSMTYGLLVRSKTLERADTLTCCCCCCC
jgi:hypothetical protein